MQQSIRFILSLLAGLVGLVFGFYVSLTLIVGVLSKVFDGGGLLAITPFFILLYPLCAIATAVVFVIISRRPASRLLDLPYRITIFYPILLIAVIFFLIHR